MQGGRRLGTPASLHGTLHAHAHHSMAFVLIAGQACSRHVHITSAGVAPTAHAACQSGAGRAHCLAWLSRSAASSCASASRKSSTSACASEASASAAASAARSSHSSRAAGAPAAASPSG